MNELRMYVEHLFEGRVLTPEMIELKEEIYGNLMARYEDLRASGVADGAALEQAKASLTSIDDVLAEQQEALGSVDAAGTGAEAADTGADAASSASDEAPAAPTDVLASTDRPAAPAGTPASTGTVRKKPSKRTLVILGIAVAVLLVVGAAGYAFYETVLEDRIENAVEHGGQTGTGGGVGNGTGAGTGTGTGAGAGNGTGAGTGATPSFDDDADGVVTVQGESVLLDGKPGDEVIRAVVASSAATVRPFAGTSPSDTTKVGDLLNQLPMGSWKTRQAPAAGGVLEVTYDAVPDRFDGDAIDAALVYNATALMSVMPEVSAVRFALSESDDVADYDYYEIQRTVLESAYGVQLDEVLVSDSNWKQVKEGKLYRAGFVERIIDQSERS